MKEFLWMVEFQREHAGNTFCCCMCQMLVIARYLEGDVQV